MPNILPALRAATFTALFASAVLASHAQSAPVAGPPPPLDPTYKPTLTFDVATIREEDTGSGNSIHVGITSPVHSSEFTANFFVIKGLIQSAYGVGTPIAGGPDWLSSRFYNIRAKSDPSVDAQLAKLTVDQARMEKQHMLQALLADRLKLKFHWEIRETPVYEMTIAKGGSKMHELTIDPTSDPEHPKPPSTGTDVKASGSQHGLEFQVSTASIQGIAAMLNSQVDRPVVNKTGLTGNYAFTLRFGRDWSAHDPESYPDIFTAVQEQLGLKIEATKASVSVLVIDHIEAPSAN